MSGRIDLSMDFNTVAAENKRNRESHYQVYILGGFSGRSDLNWEQRKIQRIDSDSFDQVMSKIQPTVEIAGSVQLSFETLEDFHPDVWLHKVKIIADLQVLKRQLSNPVTAAQAAANIQAFLPAKTVAEDIKPSVTIEESQDEMLHRLLGKEPEQRSETADTVDSMIEQIVAPFVSKSAAPQYQGLIDTIDQALSQCARVILHDPKFKNLEALWLATQALVNEEFADEQQIFLVDMTQAELAEALKQDGQIVKQIVMRHIQASDGEQKDVLLLGDFSFSDSEQHRQLLADCNDLAISCGGYFLAAADQSLLGVLAGESRAQYLRNIAADRMMLTYPRFLSRLPYGKKRDPIESFAFEESSEIPLHEELLWGCPAFIVARGLVRTSQAGGSQDALFFSDIPVFSFDKDGEQILQPGTETVLTESQANGLFAAGIMPLISYRQMRGIRLMGIKNLA